MPTDAARLDEVLRHPDFPGAMAAVMQAGLDLYTGNRLLNLVANDRGRFIVAVLAVAMDAEPGGLTAARLGAVCTASGLCSAGRARALLHLMKWAGHLTEEGRRLRPTPRLVALHRERLSRVVPHFARLRPALHAVAPMLDRPGLVEAYCAGQARRFLAGTRVGDPAPKLMPIVERTAGLLVMFALEEASRHGDAVPVAQLARRFGVSRAHVLDLLRRAEALGLVCREPEGHRATAALHEGLARIVAGAILLNESCLLEALAALVSPAFMNRPPR